MVDTMEGWRRLGLLLWWVTAAVAGICGALGALPIVAFLFGDAEPIAIGLGLMLWLCAGLVFGLLRAATWIAQGFFKA